MRRGRRRRHHTRSMLHMSSYRLKAIHRHQTFHFHDVAQIATFDGTTGAPNYPNSGLFVQPFIIAPERDPPQGTLGAFFSMFKNMEYMEMIWDEYRIAGCKVTIHMQRYDPVSAGVTTVAPMVYVVHDSKGAMSSRFGANAGLLPDSWNFQEITSDPACVQHYFRGQSLIIHHYVPFDETVQEMSMWQPLHPDALGQNPFYRNNLADEQHEYQPSQPEYQWY